MMASMKVISLLPFAFMCNLYIMTCSDLYIFCITQKKKAQKNVQAFFSPSYKWKMDQLTYKSRMSEKSV